MNTSHRLETNRALWAVHRLWSRLNNLCYISCLSSREVDCAASSIIAGICGSIVLIFSELRLRQIELINFIISYSDAVTCLVL